jgi:hypothetical protein
VRFVIVGGGTAGIAAAQKAPVACPPLPPSPFWKPKRSLITLRPGLIEVLAGKKELSEITPYSRGLVSKNAGLTTGWARAAVSLDPARREVFSFFRESDPPTTASFWPWVQSPSGRGYPAWIFPEFFTLRTAADVERIRTWAAGAKARGGSSAEDGLVLEARLCPPKYA